MVYIRILLYPLYFLLICSACKKEEEKLQEQLPPITTEGKMTFGCIIRSETPVVFKVEGKYIPPSAGGFFGISCTGGSEIRPYSHLVGGEKKLYVHANTCDYDYPYEISLQFPQNVATGDEITIDAKNTNSARLWIGSLDRLHFTADSIAGYGKIKFLRADSIFSGTFSFTAYDHDNDYYLSVTDGRFDIKMD